MNQSFIKIHPQGSTETAALSASVGRLRGRTFSRSLCFTLAVIYSLSPLMAVESSRSKAASADQTAATIDLKKGEHIFHNADKSKSFVGRLVNYDSKTKKVSLLVKGKSKVFKLSIDKLAKQHHPDIVNSVNSKNSKAPLLVVKGATTSRKFQNSPVPNQKNTSVCSGVAAIIATEQALGRKHQGMKTVLDLAAMINPSNRDGRSSVSSEFAMSCYGLAYEDFTPASTGVYKYSTLEGLSRIKEAVKDGNIAVIGIKRRGKGHALSLSDYREHPTEGPQWKVMDSNGGNVSWQKESILVDGINLFSPGKIKACIVDCSQLITGDKPVESSGGDHLADSAHDTKFCSKLEKSLKKMQSKLGTDFIPGFGEIEDGTSIVNIACYWGGKVNQDAVNGICDIFRSNLLAQRSLSTTINIKDQVRFASLVGEDKAKQGFYFKVDNQKIYVLNKDLPSKLSSRIDCKFNGSRDNLILAYGRDEKGKAVIVPKKGQKEIGRP